MSTLSIRVPSPPGSSRECFVSWPLGRTTGPLLQSATDWWAWESTSTGTSGAFLADRPPSARYASFDYCFNHFPEVREAGDTTVLVDDDHLMLSCLQLGFYLASWGMMRGSGDLLQRSLRELVPVVEAIASESSSTWDLDAHSLTKHADDVLALSRRVRKAFTVSASDTLVTKTMLGVFGCVPAFDRYFRIGFGCQTLCKDALFIIGTY